MAVAFDAVSASGVSASEATFTFSHNPVGTPAGILVFVFVNGSTTDLVTGVTYDGTAMVAVTGGRAVDTSTEVGSCKAYFLGSSVPTTDPSDVVVSRTNNATEMSAVAFSVTAGEDTATAGVVLEQENQSLAEVNVDDGTPGANSVRFAGLFTGRNSLPAEGASTTAGAEVDFGSTSSGAAYETTAGQGSRPVGFALGASDDVAAVYLAVIESGPATFTRAANLDAALQEQDNLRTANLSGALQEIDNLVTASINGALAVLAEINSNLDAALQAEVLPTAQINAALKETDNLVTALLDAALSLADQEVTTGIDAAISRLVERTAALSGALQAPDQLATTVLNAALQSLETVTASLNASLIDGGAITITTEISAALRDTFTAIASISAALQAADLTATASVDGVLRAEVTLTASINASLDLAIVTRTITAVLSAALQRQNVETSTEIDAALLIGRTVTALVSAVLAAQRTAAVSLDAVLADARLITSQINSALLGSSVLTCGLDAKLIGGIIKFATSRGIRVRSRTAMRVPPGDRSGAP